MTTTIIIFNKHSDVTVEQQDRAQGGPKDRDWLHMWTRVIEAGEMVTFQLSGASRRFIITEGDA